MRSRPTGYIQRQMKTWGRNYDQADAVVRDPATWKAAGLTFRDDGDAMPRLREYLDAHVEGEIAAAGAEPVCIVHVRPENHIVARQALPLPQSFSSY